MADAIDKILSELSLNDPASRSRIAQGFTRRTTLTAEQEAQYRKDMIARGLEKYLDDPTYDNRAAWLAGNLPNRVANPGQHGQSDYKGLGDDRLFLPIGANGQMLDTRTAQPTPNGGPNAPWTGPAPDPRLLNLWKVISSVMNK